MNKIVKIEFLDHAQVQDIKLDDVNKASPIRCTVYGELLVDEEDHVTVLCCYQEEVEDGEPQNHAMVIVKDAIISMKELREAQP